MLKIIAACILAFAFQGHGGIGTIPNNCSGKRPSDFPPPPTLACAPGHTMNPSCLAACISHYQTEMLELEEMQCQAEETIRLNFRLAVAGRCTPPYLECWAKCYPNTASCDAIFQACRENIWPTYAAQLTALYAIIDDARNAVEDTLADCTGGCCQ